jgi:hypothetical protein
MLLIAGDRLGGRLAEIMKITALWFLILDAGQALKNGECRRLNALDREPDHAIQ